MNEIAATESTRLTELETTIEQGLQTFVDVGNALMEIRDNRLYRQQFGTFEDYCQDRWGMSRPRVYQLIDAAETVNNLSTIVDKIPPSNEAQARPLSSLPPQLQREVWPLVVDTAPNGKITAAHVQSVVDDYLRPDEHLDAALTDESRPVCSECGQVYDGANCPDCHPVIKETNRPHVSFNNGNNEWYTPVEYIEAATLVMGNIDLDPASSEIANSIVKARLFYTADDNGLGKEWGGNVWMNPPYARDLVPQFASKLIENYQNGKITQAITLTNNSTETGWFQAMAEVATGLCLPKGRVQFWHPSKESAPLQGQAILYFGNNTIGFQVEFEKFGVVWTNSAKI